MNQLCYTMAQPQRMFWCFEHLKKIQVSVVIFSLFEKILWQSISDLELTPAVKPTKTLLFLELMMDLCLKHLRKRAFFFLHKAYGALSCMLCSWFIWLCFHTSFLLCLTHGPWPWFSLSLSWCWLWDPQLAICSIAMFPCLYVEPCITKMTDYLLEEYVDILGWYNKMFIKTRWSVRESANSKLGLN